jgi:hypothetical protein
MRTGLITGIFVKSICYENGYQSLSLVQRTLISMVAFLALVVDIYHCTHSGRGSGILE